jgi:flagellin-like hook-associated protein FlgL
MAINSFSAGGYAARVRSDQLVSLRADFDNLQRQLTTGKKASTYGELGIDRRISLDVHAKVSRLDGWLAGIEQADLRIKFQNQSTEAFVKATQDAKSDVRPASYVLTATGKTTGQILVEDKLRQTIDSLNVDIDGRYLFSGRTTDTKPVETFDRILNGDGAGRAGVIQLISERRQADLGTALQGRLAVGGVGTTITLDEEAANPPYGFKIAGAISSTAAITSTYTAGTPASLALNVTGTPVVGDTVKIVLNLPDGTTEEIELAARNPTVSGNAYDSFAIGTTPAATAANLQAALTAAVQREAATTLSAASSTIAALDFFNGTATNPPLRVPGPGFATATTAPVPGTAANTIIWYKGDDDATVSARGTSPLQIDESQTVNIGARANEQAFRIGLAQFAAITAETYSATDPTARDRYEALSTRARNNLSFTGGVQRPSEISTELATARVSIEVAVKRHNSTKNFLGQAVDKVENASKEEVSVRILELQTRLQATYQTTSILSQLSLTNYLR